MSVKPAATWTWVRASGEATARSRCYAPKRIPLGWVDSGDEWARLVLPGCTAKGPTIGPTRPVTRVARSTSTIPS